MSTYDAPKSPAELSSDSVGSGKAPRITIITPAYNAAPYITETVESVLAQDYPNLEYIVLDDGSIDDTLAQLTPYRDRITLVTHPNMGEQRTVNRGVEMASGEIIGIVNADDPILPDLVKVVAEALTIEPDLIAVYPDWKKIDENDKMIVDVQTLEYDYKIMLAQHYCIPGPGAFFRKSALAGEPARDEALRYSGDFYMWLRLGLRGPMARIPRTLATWREHSASASQAMRGPVMARNKISAVKRLFARDDIPDQVRALRRQALSSAYHCAALLAIHDWRVPGRRYFLTSLLLKPIWPRQFLKHQRRSWAHFAYVFGLPLSVWIYKAYHSFDRR